MVVWTSHSDGNAFVVLQRHCAAGRVDLAVRVVEGANVRSVFWFVSFGFDSRWGRRMRPNSVRDGAGGQCGTTSCG